MYESPIKIIQGQIQTQMEGKVLKAVQQIGINVDKESLLQALKYDRNQYSKGYHDAIMDMDLVKVVRCKDCKHWDKDFLWCDRKSVRMAENDFCSYGERK